MRRRTRIGIGICCVVLISLYILSPITFEPLENVTTGRYAQLSINSDKWNGLSMFRSSLESEGYEVRTIISNTLVLKEVDDPEKTLYICIGAERVYDPFESQALLTFVNKGGKVLIADDSGKSNSFAEKLGVRFTGHDVWSQDFLYNASMIRIDANVSNKEYSVLLNEPTTLRVFRGTRSTFKQPSVAYFTSSDSYEDTNDNGRIDSIGERDKFGELLVGAFVDSKKGSGRISFIADSSFCINSMWEKERNANFSLTLVQDLLGFHGMVIFDESRHIQHNPVENSLYSLENFYFYMLLHHAYIDESLDQNSWLVPIFILSCYMSLFLVFYFITPPPKRFLNKFDLTYICSFEMINQNRLSDVKNILKKRLMRHCNIYFPDSSSEVAYEQFKKTSYDLKKKSDLQALITTPEIVKFYLHPQRFKSEEQLKIIIEKINSEFPIKEGIA